MTYQDAWELLSALEIPSVSLGYTSVRVSAIDELDDAQIGYAVDPPGASLVDGAIGSWRRQWIVIGYEDSCGDPIFIDAEAEGFPVYTAMHGGGKWEPSLIATGLRSFAAAMRDVARLAEGRENPVRLDAKPIAAAERRDVLDSVQRQNPGIDSSFWESLLGT